MQAERLSPTFWHRLSVSRHLLTKQYRRLSIVYIVTDVTATSNRPKQSCSFFCKVARGCSQSQCRNRCGRGRPALASLFTVFYVKNTDTLLFAFCYQWRWQQSVKLLQLGYLLHTVLYLSVFCISLHDWLVQINTTLLLQFYFLNARLCRLGRR